ncbi:AraC family transcriptional regulator [Paraburkholderia phenazinium]|jgi:AraC-like DNA-binding protein|uniref:AraC-type DNA-binding protein n=1 Tax=Paraburkholderia phenazinium TaxID=60549 RepID=A0A1G7R8N3_9BURK|nr:AraC family transcriptional regulator [Paraburkholderia phenazinium]SDG07034.1 AraC-type DNA-binding protein [Paraburkholderia phenazinium]
MAASRVQMPRCALAGVEATVAETAHAFPRHSHDRFGVGVIVRGGHRSASGRGLVEARVNDAIMVNPGEVHDGSPLDERGRAWRMLYFEPALLHDAALELAAKRPGVVPRQIELTQPVAHDPVLNALFERLFLVSVTLVGPGDALARETALLQMLGHLGRHHTTLSGASSREEAGPVTRAKARIDDDPAAQLTLAELAAEAGMSRFQLLRCFAQQIGLPPHAYRMQRRVVLARQWIARGATLADAAAAAGFADQSHMTRAFVRLLGVTPANYAAATR